MSPASLSLQNAPGVTIRRAGACVVLVVRRGRGLVVVRLTVGFFVVFGTEAIGRGEDGAVVGAGVLVARTSGGIGSAAVVLLSLSAPPSKAATPRPAKTTMAPRHLRRGGGSSTQNCQPSGGPGHDGSGSHPGGGFQSRLGGRGQLGGGLNRCAMN
jgi:hypothetical protein